MSVLFEQLTTQPSLDIFMSLDEISVLLESEEGEIRLNDCRGRFCDVSTGDPECIFIIPYKEPGRTV
jgi:hypothetical protein